MVEYSREVYIFELVTAGAAMSSLSVVTRLLTDVTRRDKPTVTVIRPGSGSRRRSERKLIC